MTEYPTIVAACADHTMLCDKPQASGLWAQLSDEVAASLTCHKGPHRCDPAGPAFAWPIGTASTKAEFGTIPDEWPEPEPGCSCEGPLHYTSCWWCVYHDDGRPQATGDPAIDGVVI